MGEALPRESEVQNKTPQNQKLYSMIKLHKGNNTIYNQEALCGGLFCMELDFSLYRYLRFHDIVNYFL